MLIRVSSLDCTISVNNWMLLHLSVIVKRVRQPAVISQRRPVTEEEKDLALRRAKQFKSKNPFAVQTMMESYVYVGFFMVISLISHMLLHLYRMSMWDFLCGYHLFPICYFIYIELKTPCSCLHEQDSLMCRKFDFFLRCHINSLNIILKYVLRNLSIITLS